MWICLNNAFLSIVAKDCGPDELMVRARRRGDIERAFPGVKATRTVGNDYLWRAVVKRDAVAMRLADLVAGIAYSNFKNSVREDRLHDAYARVWSVMASMQEVAPYSRPAVNSPAAKRARQGGLL